MVDVCFSWISCALSWICSRSQLLKEGWWEILHRVTQQLCNHLLLQGISKTPQRWGALQTQKSPHLQVVINVVFLHRCDIYTDVSALTSSLSVPSQRDCWRSSTHSALQWWTARRTLPRKTARVTRRNVHRPSAQLTPEDESLKTSQLTLVHTKCGQKLLKTVWWAKYQTIFLSTLDTSYKLIKGLVQTFWSAALGKGYEQFISYLL